MHLCLFISSLHGGGAERVALTLARAWAGDPRITCITLVTSDTGSEPQEVLPTNVGTLRLPLQSQSWTILAAINSNIRRIRLLRGTLKQLRPDVVIAFMDEMAVLLTLAAQGTGIPVIAGLRAEPSGPDLRAIWRWLRMPTYRFLSDAVVVQTQTGLAQAKRLFPGALLSVIGNPLPELPPVPAMAERTRLITSAGRLIPSKRFDLLIEAFARSRWRDNGWHLRIHGEGPERFRLEKQIAELGLEQVVTLPGFTNDLAARLAEAAIFAFASRSEGFPNALLEAAAMGCACVSTDCSTGPSEILMDGTLGLLVPVDDQQALTDALNRLMADVELRSEMGGNWQHFRKQYSMEAIAATWLDLADQLGMNGRSPKS